MTQAYMNDLSSGVLEVAPEKPLGTIFSPIEIKILSALRDRTSVEKLCQRLNFEFPQGEVLETIQSLVSKELVVVVCSAYPWGVEFDYISREAALTELKGSSSSA